MSQTATKRYRANFILDTRNYTESIETLIESISEAITSLGATVTKVDNKGSQDFIRVTDRRMPSGVYVNYEIEAGPEIPAQMQEKFRLDKTVNRILVQSI
ncbi:30S ribosomal protein S6 [Cerasicoccus maritimus]|uniref:30S ribosomal protein S6 n=1 Tax=Cerasicoccus maritimus TaxID=490089 RepID=UPI0028528BCE|nr:30S ribosomal protein S6 [Cerasicoccus maritimus]